MPVGRQLPIAPDALAIARCLIAAGQPRLAVLHASERRGRYGRWSYVAAEPDRVSEELDPLHDDPDVETAGWQHEIQRSGRWAHVPRWIGVIPYEARRGLERASWTPRESRPPPALVRPRWHRFSAVVCIDHVLGRVFAVGAGEAVERLSSVLRREAPDAPVAGRLEARDTEPVDRHAQRVAAALELIARGDLYQVNLARSIHVAYRGRRTTATRAELLSLHAQLAAAAPTPFGACLELDDELFVVSTSPELLLDATVARRAAEFVDISTTFESLFTAPIKGTRPRGGDASSDERERRALDDDPKERAELTMIVDVVRHDLGRVAETGSVRVAASPHVVTHRTVHHREAHLAARVRRGVSRHEVVAVMVPSGSVTGAPKVRAMEVIAGLEAGRRGLYTGGIGYVAHDGSMRLAMAIRTVVLEGGEGQYLTGGGIVADSDPLRELEETRWKALQLERAATVGYDM